MTIRADQIAAARTADILATARRFTILKREGSSEHVGPCPRCGGHRFGVNTRKRVFNCRGCGAGGDVIALVMVAKGASFAEAVAELAGQATVSNWQRRVPDPSPDENAILTCLADGMARGRNAWSRSSKTAASPRLGSGAVCARIGSAATWPRGTKSHHHRPRSRWLGARATNGSRLLVGTQGEQVSE